jgi:hypothetical protein
MKVKFSKGTPTINTGFGITDERAMELHRVLSRAVPDDVPIGSSEDLIGGAVTAFAGLTLTPEEIAYYFLKLGMAAKASEITSTQTIGDGTPINDGSAPLAPGSRLTDAELMEIGTTVMRIAPEAHAASVIVYFDGADGKPVAVHHMPLGCDNCVDKLHIEAGQMAMANRGGRGFGRIIEKTLDADSMEPDELEALAKLFGDKLFGDKLLGGGAKGEA